MLFYALLYLTVLVVPLWPERTGYEGTPLSPPILKARS